MEEKKLTDEEIVKVLECCIKEEHKDCVHCGEFVSQFDCMRNSISNALDLIHRLQEDNKNYDYANAELMCTIFEQKAEIERLTKESDEMFDRHAKENQAATILLEQRNKEIAEQKAEIERLNNRISDMEFVGKGNCMDCKLVEDIYTLDTKYNELKEKTFSYETELLELREDRERFRARNAELQKQVDELKAENTELYKEHTTLIAGSILEKQDIVKETAQEALENFICQLVNARLVSTKEDLYDELLESKDYVLKEKYGVEVE